MSNIHPTAIIEDGAQVDSSASIGAFTIIESGAVIGPGCIIESSVRIFSPVTLGKDNRVCHGAVLGCEPQDLGYTPDKSKPLTIGDNNHFKEGVNISRGVKTETGTIIGNSNYFMCGFHAGHDVQFGDNNVFGPNSAIAGHVILGNRVFVSGLVAIHQFVTVGDFAMLGGCAKIVKDIPPYTTADGNPARILGLNIVGLRRGGFSTEARKQIKRVYKTLFQSGLNISQATDQLKTLPESDEIITILHFIQNSQRGITAHR
jgi:UDP-N-acetylglucosamine acyltransferase